MRLYTDEASCQTLEVIEARDDGLAVFRSTEGPYETRITCSPHAFFIEPKRMLERPQRAYIIALPPTRPRPIMAQITDPENKPNPLRRRQ